MPQELNRRSQRSFLKKFSLVGYRLLSRLEITGEENIPEKGPLIIVGNHFSFLDPTAVVRIAPWPVEFVGGAFPPHAPKWTLIIPRMWGFHKLYRGTGSRDALRAAEGHLKNGGVLSIFPEGGNWAEVLRPPRPGTAYLAARTGAKLLPIGLDGFVDAFPGVLYLKRPRVRINIGKTFGPFSASGSGRDYRNQIDEIGHEVMRHIAPLIPPEKRGFYSDDPAIREAARGTEIYPWADKVEGEVEGEIR